MTITSLSETITGLLDVRRGYVDPSAVEEGVQRGSTLLLRGHANTVAIGRQVPVKVNTNIGISHTTPYEMERAKLDRLAVLGFAPDLIMDHTIDPPQRNFWREIVETFDGPVGTLPQYTSYRPSKGLPVSALVERIEEMLAGGVAFMTL